MKVRLLFFSILRDYFHESEKEIEMDEPVQARTLFLSLFKDSRLACQFLRSTRFALNNEYVAPETVIRGGDELAFIPPTSGG
ncbi:MAG: MoaD/ThiS family protein [Deltaproteobacteria bacterium]|nr:MoaD/ThiS family protein [Deltaproteobacteria bacterium]MBI2501589.1 MoaD/ThiS family protein [Deltaproteobacteria bacterium]MBI4196434.1 MoaD/ThiS family protein [Deltaproteobacteria bacterium]